MAKMKETIETKTRFSKIQILKANRFKKRRDILQVLLDDGKTYSTEEVLEILENKMKGKVN